jgi:hypothetical protein
MSVPLKGKRLPDSGKVLPSPRKRRRVPSALAVSIAKSLKEELEGSRRAAKTVIKWTGASERAVKGWIAGSSGPSAEHLISLVRHSDILFERFLEMTGRNRVMVSTELFLLRDRLTSTVEAIDAMGATKGKR